MYGQEWIPCEATWQEVDRSGSTMPVYVEYHVAIEEGLQKLVDPFYAVYNVPLNLYHHWEMCINRIMVFIPIENVLAMQRCSENIASSL